MESIPASVKRRSRNRFRGRVVAGGCAAVMVAALAGCDDDVNLVQSVTIVPGQTLALNRAVHFNPGGVGTCRVLRMDWGDGLTNDFTNVDLTARTDVSHQFTGWGGGRTVTAIGTSGCEGRANARFNIPPASTTIGFAQPGPNTCTAVPRKSPLAARTLVHITTTPVTGEFAFGIDFGCPFQGCRYDADGKPDSAAAPPFPFPGLREFSLVLRVGSQVVQGGKDVRFTTTQSGPLEICINDNNLSDNRGGYQINIEVDQLGPATP